MNTKFTIKNFRVFDEQGVSIDIKPMTILTGCNSSGKSSIVKAAFLLNSFIKQVSNAIENGEKIELSKYKLDFTGYPNNLLGRFDKVISEGSSSKKVTLGYSVHSCMLSNNVDVELVFAADKNDELNNAYLDRISMSTDEGVFFSSDKENGNYCNLNIIKKYFMDYVKIEFLIDNYCGLIGTYETGLGEPISKDEFKTQQTNMFEILRRFERKRVLDVVNYIRTKKGSFKCIGSKSSLGLLDWTEESGSYFNIPVLKYLRSVKKEDLKTTIEKELVSDNESNALSASPAAIKSATDRIVADFLHSDFESFDDYFKDLEQRYFEHIILINKECPCMLHIGLKQGYTRSYIAGSWEFGELNFGNEAPKRKDNKSKEQKIKEWENRPITFDILYEVVMLWNELYTVQNSIKSEYYRAGRDIKTVSDFFVYPDGYHHYVFEMLTVFAKQLAEEVICPIGFDNMSYVSSSRATVKKLYALDEKDDFTGLLQRYFENKRIFQEKNSLKTSTTPDYEANSFMNKWIKQFGLGDSLSFKLDEEGLGVKIRLHKSADDSGRLLSDEGYGITQLISVLLQIETAILSAKGEKANYVYGLSAFDKYDTSEFHFEENTIAIEEPEIHLHPSYQSKLAEMFAEATSKYNIHFIIETHSEYLIRKLQTFVAYKRINADNISLCYVYSPDDYVSPSDTRVKQLTINDDGSLADSFGSGFFDEADNLSVELMSLKM